MINKNIFYTTTFIPRARRNSGKAIAARRVAGAASEESAIVRRTPRREHPVARRFVRWFRDERDERCLRGRADAYREEQREPRASTRGWGRRRRLLARPARRQVATVSSSSSRGTMHECSATAQQASKAEQSCRSRGCHVNSLHSDLCDSIASTPLSFTLLLTP